MRLQVFVRRRGNEIRIYNNRHRDCIDCCSAMVAGGDCMNINASGNDYDGMIHPVDEEYCTTQEYLEYQADTPEGKNNQAVVLSYLSRRPKGNILDVGARNPLTDLIKDRTGFPVDNTVGNLDFSFTAPGKDYWTIVFSHVIEHLHNPLSCLVRLHELLHPNGKLLIFTPWCSENFKLRFSNCHYHEIDEKRMGKMLALAGFVVEKITYYKRPGGGFHGVRPLIRLFQQKNVIYECRKK